MPIPTQVLRLADAVAGACGTLHRPFSIDGLIRTARRRARSEDFGDVDITEPLRRLLDACTTEARLSLVGRLATQWDVVRFLSNLLRLRAAESARPEILDEPIAQPIFITGLPRSGTTFLHRMMLEDPANRAPLVYETIYPCAPAPGRRDRRAAQVASQLRTFDGAGARVPRPASAGGDLAAGMQRDHRARVPQPALRHQLSHSVLPRLAGCGSRAATCRPTGSTAASCSICSTRMPLRPPPGPPRALGRAGC